VNALASSQLTPRRAGRPSEALTASDLVRYEFSRSFW